MYILSIKYIEVTHFLYLLTNGIFSIKLRIITDII